MRYMDLIAEDVHKDTRNADEIKDDIKAKLRNMRDGFI